MKVRITKPTRVNLLSGEVEVSDVEYNRLMLLGAVEPVIEKKQIEVPEQKVERKTRKAKQPFEVKDEHNIRKSEISVAYNNG